MRFSIAKNKKIGSKPVFHTYSGPLNAVKNIVFSPDQKRLLVTTHDTPASLVQPPDISCIYVINEDGSIYRKLVEVTHDAVWIDNDTFAYIEYNQTLNEYSSLNVFNCVTEKVIKISLGNHNIADIKRIIFNNNKIIFLYRIVPNNYGIATCDITNLTNATKLIYTLFNEADFFSVDDFFALENNELILLGSSGDDQSEKKLYELKADKPIAIAQVYKGESKYDLVGLNKCAISLDRKKIAFSVSINEDLATTRGFAKEVIIYSFETKEAIKCNTFNYVRAVQFDVQNKLLLVGCHEEIMIFSAITGEKICEFKQSDNQAFKNNWSLALGGLSDNRLVVGAHRPLQTAWQIVRGILVPNLFMWQLIPHEYLPAWNRLINQKQLSLSNRILLSSLYHRSREGKKPVILTPDEKASFHAIDPRVQEFFTNIDYVAPGQMSEQPVQADTSRYKHKTPPLKKLGRNYWDWLKALKANFSWENLMKYFPSSG